MKQSNAFDPGSRMVPRDWIRMGGTQDRGPQDRGPAEESHEPYRWMATFAAPLAHVRTCALEVLNEMGAALAYRYETDEKVIVRCTLLERQIRAELKPLEAQSTRVVIVTMRGTDVDRVTSGRVVSAIERKLEAAGYRLRD